MGVYRFVLAALVVFFHFGGLSWVAGRVAVFAFYAVSGFLIFQVLDRVYLGERRGVGRFLLNRLMRLGPSYLLYTVATLLVIRLAGAALDVEGRLFVIGGGQGSGDLLRASLTFDPAFRIDRFVPIMEFAPPLIPQGWSIGVELSFYLIAPLVVLTTRKRPVALGLWIAVGAAVFLAAVYAAGIDFDHFQTMVYKNAVASWFVFFLGGAFYYARRRWGQPFRFEIAAALLLAWVLLLVLPTLGVIDLPPRAAAVFTQFLWLTLLLAGVVTVTDAGRFRTIDRAAGNLCYAVYLNHFIVAALLVWMGATAIVGVPGTLSFAAVVLLGSALLGALTYRGVERPFEALRARVRGKAVREEARDVVREAPAASWRLPRQIAAATAGVVLAIVMTPPVGTVVERLVAAMPVDSSHVSAPFDIRWKPDVTEDSRRRIEEALGLTSAEPVLRDPRRRTWSYRLRQPTPERVRSIVMHPAVEDTARVDPSRFVILD